jgi:hypothetical protein
MTVKHIVGVLMLLLLFLAEWGFIFKVAGLLVYAQLAQ